MQVETLQKEELNIREEIFDMNVFSFSRLTKYEDCPFQFFQKYVLEKEEPKSFPLALGNATHNAIEKILKGEDKALATGEALMEEDFFEGYDEDPLTCINMLKDFVATAPVDELLKRNAQIESFFKIPLSNEDNAPYIRGYIDVIVDNQEIWDWKTNKWSYDVTNDHQQGLYAWAISEKHNLTGGINARLFFLRNGYYSQYIYGEKEQEEARLWAYDVAKDIQNRLQELKQDPTMSKAAKLFQANTNKFC